jgi:predicted nucleotidyltransferase component of viral defense system
MNNSSYYSDVLYPFQDLLFQSINLVDTEFYLTGGTAASRGYLNHRFSDDLDYFVNDDDRFTIWVERIIQDLIRQSDWKCQITMKEDRFVRSIVSKGDLAMKIEWVNDVTTHAGEIQNHP